MYKLLKEKLKSIMKENTQESTNLYLIVGLGNPGKEYQNNRHNAGFMAVDRLAKDLGTTFSRVEADSLIAKTSYEGKRIILIKPQTYMNNSGRAVKQLVKYYKIPLENSIILFDDVDLPLGTIRIRTEGGSGGQKGMASIIQHLGTQSFPRLRIGIGRPPGKMDAAAYVLQNFSKSEKEILEITIDKAVKAVQTFISYDIETAMNKFNGDVT